MTRLFSGEGCSLSETGLPDRRDLTASGDNIFCVQGFYQLSMPNRASLVIGPYQGSHGCLRIPRGRGVCGVAAAKRETQLVEDVHAFPGHIACASS